MTKNFVYISGEHIDVAKAEVNALARLLGIDESFYWDGRVGLVNSQENLAPYFLGRAALVKEAGVVLSESDGKDGLFENLADDVLLATIKPEDTFSVRTISKDGWFSVKERLDFETSLGAHIKQVVGAKVNLENPQTRFLVVFTKDKIRICVSFASELRPMLRNREPGLKPFFHPSMMNATLARVMCNLAGVKPGDIMLDPFCGGGGILCEAALIGARVIGVDLNWRLLKGSKENLSSISNQYCLVQGDVQNLPIHRCDCIVTDPPYGRASSTRGAEAIGLVESLFERTDSILQRQRKSICICGSSEMGLKDVAERMGLVVSQVLQIRVHSGLVREIIILLI